MKFAIAGAGVAGSYLGRMLTIYGHQVEIFESYKKESHWPVCAWGASKNMLSYFSDKANLDFNNYILHTGKNLRIDLPGNKSEFLSLSGLVTYDKQKWEQDLLKDISIKYDSKCDSNFNFSDYDYVLDCTGLHRSLLPRSEHDFLIPAYEYLVENVNDIDDEFFVIAYKGARGYFWYFPLGDGRGFVGAGDIDRKYFGVQEFLKKNPNIKILRKIGRPIRLSPPKNMLPFHHGNVIGVGESIGCVFPMLGEGIIPSLLCADIFLNVLNKKNKKFDINLYTKLVLKKFNYYYDVYQIVRLKMNQQLNSIKHGNLLLKMYLNMKKDEKRFGFEVNFNKMKTLVNAL